MLQCRINNLFMHIASKVKTFGKLQLKAGASPRITSGAGVRSPITKTTSGVVANI